MNKLPFKPFVYFYFVLITFGFSCNQKTDEKTDEGQNQTPEINIWDNVLKESKGKTLQLLLSFKEDRLISFIEDHVAPEVLRDFDIEIIISICESKELVNCLNEKTKSNEKVDLIWIANQNMFPILNDSYLVPKLARRIPNTSLYDPQDSYLNKYGQIQTSRYLIPFGQSQECIIYNQNIVPNPPKNIKSFDRWIKDNPGKFTLPTDDYGVNLLYTWMLELSGDQITFTGRFNEEKYIQASTRLWDFINQQKSFYWRNGVYYPKTHEDLDQLFINQEVGFTIGEYLRETERKVEKGIFLEQAKDLVMDIGSVKYAHFMGVSKLSKDIKPCLVVLNYLLSTKSQAVKMKTKVWGDSPVLDVNRLPDIALIDFGNELEQDPLKQQFFNAVERPDQQYLDRLKKDFVLNIIER